MKQSGEEQLINFGDNDLKDYQIQLLDEIEISKPKHLKILCEKLKEEHYYTNFIDEFLKDHHKITRDFYRLNNKKRNLNAAKNTINMSISYNSRNISPKNLKDRQKGTIIKKLNGILPKIGFSNQIFLHNQSINPPLISLSETYTSMNGSQPKNELPSISHYERRLNTNHELNEIIENKESALLSNKFPLTEINEKVDTMKVKDDDIKKESNDNCIMEAMEVRDDDIKKASKND